MKSTSRASWLSARKGRRNRVAFTLLELMIGLFIIGLGASMVVPRLLRRSPDAEWTALHEELNTMLCFARQEAIRTQKVHRLTFNKKQRTMAVEERDGETEKGEPKFSLVSSIYFDTTYTFPDSVRIEAVKLGKKELLEEHKGNAWCYIVPNGLVQKVVITLVRDEQGTVEKKRYESAPFLGVFAEAEETREKS